MHANYKHHLYVNQEILASGGKERVFSLSTTIRYHSDKPKRKNIFFLVFSKGAWLAHSTSGKYLYQQEQEKDTSWRCLG